MLDLIVCEIGLVGGTGNRREPSVLSVRQDHTDRAFPVGYHREGAPASTHVHLNVVLGTQCTDPSPDCRVLGELRRLFLDAGRETADRSQALRDLFVRVE